MFIKRVLQTGALYKQEYFLIYLELHRARFSRWTFTPVQEVHWTSYLCCSRLLWLEAFHWRFAVSVAMFSVSLLWRDKVFNRKNHLKATGLKNRNRCYLVNQCTHHYSIFDVLIWIPTQNTIHSGRVCTTHEKIRKPTITSHFGYLFVFEILSVHSKSQSPCFKIPLVWRAFSKISVFVTEGVWTLASVRKILEFVSASLEVKYPLF